MDRRLERFFLPAHPLLISPQSVFGPGVLDRDTFLLPVRCQAFVSRRSSALPRWSRHYNSRPGRTLLRRTYSPKVGEGSFCGLRFEGVLSGSAKGFSKYPKKPARRRSPPLVASASDGNP